MGSEPASAKNQRGLLSSLWEISLLRPAVFVVRALLTLGFGLAELAVVVGLIRTGKLWKVPAGVAVMVLIAIVYLLYMLVPDLWAILLSWESSVGRGTPPRGRYLGLFLASDLGRLAAVFLLAAGGLQAMRAVLPGLFAVRGGPLPGWWRAWLGLGFLGGLIVAGWRSVPAFLGKKRERFLSGWVVLGFLSLIALELVVEGNIPIGGLGAVVFLGAAVAAGIECWRAVSREDLQRAVAAGVAGLLLAGPVLPRLGDLSNLPAGVLAVCHPWWELLVAPLLQLLSLAGLAFSRLGPASLLLYLLVLLVLSGLIAFGAWIRSDVRRTLVRVGEGLTGERYRRVQRPALVILRVASLLALAVGLLVVTFLSRAQAVSMQFFPGGLGTILGNPAVRLAAVLLWGLSLLAVVDVFQMAEDVARATSGGGNSRLLDFKWLKALMGLITAVLWLGGAAAILMWLGLLIKEGARWAAAGLLFVVPGLLVLLILSILPRFLRNLLRIEANTRPAGASRVAVAVGYPGISAYLVWGRLLMWFVVLVVLVATGIGVATLSDHMDPEGIFGLVVGGLLTAVVAAILLGSIPDFLSLLLTLERNLREVPVPDGVPGEPSPREEPVEEGGGGPGDLQTLLAEALTAMGDHLVAPPVVPPARRGVVLEGRGRRGRYTVVRRGGRLVLRGPDGAELGHFEHGRFSPLEEVHPAGQEIDAISWGDEVYRTPAVPLEQLPAAGGPTARETPGETPAETPAEPEPGGLLDASTREPTVPFDEVKLVDVEEPALEPLEGTGTPPDIVDVGPSDGLPAEPFSPPEPMVDVERTPKVTGTAAESAPFESVPTPPPPPRDAAVHRSDVAATRLPRIPMQGNTEGERVLAALTEILLLKGELRKLGTGAVRSRLVAKGVEVEAWGLNAAVGGALRRKLQAELERTLHIAAGLMEENIFELKRFSADRAVFRRSVEGRLLASGWTGGALPPLGGVIVARAGGRVLFRGRRGRRYQVTFAVNQGGSIAVYGVRM